MPVSSLHPQFAYWKEAIFDCRAAFEGGRVIKQHGQRYLPQLKDQPMDEYNAYKNRALFFAITSKTVSALVGMVMARSPIVKHSEAMAPYFTERQGAQFLEICSTTIQEVQLMGGYGLLIDAPPEGTDLPQIARYPRESVINWQVDDDGRPTLVILKEVVVRSKQGDQYEQEEVVQYRRLWLRGGVYQVDVLNEKGEQLEPTVVPTVRRQPMDHIPFYMLNPLGVSMEMMKPPMLDIVDLNISHYRTSADLEHGRHFTGLPTPVVSGIEAGSQLYIGSSKAWVLPDPQAKAIYLEFTGQGLLSLEKALQEKQGQMASLSARMIDNSKRGSEAADTVRLRFMSETAGLITTTRSVEDGLNQVYAEIAEIMGEPAPSIQMNKEFMDARLSAADLTALVKAYLEGGISKDTLVYNLRKGDIISPKQEDQAEMSEILEPGELERQIEELRAKHAAAAATKAAQNRPSPTNA